MSDEKKLTPGKYNKIINAWLNNKPYEDEDVKKYEPVEYDPCLHVWKLYRGLLKTDEYCLHCNKKRALPNEIPHTDWSGDDSGSF